MKSVFAAPKALIFLLILAAALLPFGAVRAQDAPINVVTTIGMIADVVQVIDVASLKVIQQLTPGKAVLHMEFTPRGEQVWISARDDDRVQVYDTATFKAVADLPAEKPSGIFFSARAHKIGL